jgi:hypothetical protein
LLYREDFDLADRFHGSALHGDRCIAVCEAHRNFADESACLTVGNIRNEVVTIHGSQNVLKIFFAINCFSKNIGTTAILVLNSIPESNFLGRGGTSWDRCGFCELQ